MTKLTTAQVESAIKTLAALYQAVHALGEIPTGKLYATVCNYLTLEEFTSAINQLKSTGLVRECCHVLIAQKS